eukprot:TRINITY_DN1246_c0_g2_i1.p1 TRINITY_DN1246_c0_g2~~TRINITY_DN1246_c0_g2_i1.p1  ORF type:complete len:226 (-),score=64.41 TRINITY_DN1246_c0_g2_i1:532-1209(-)
MDTWIIVAVVAVVIILGLIFTRAKSKKQNTFLIVGNFDAGKTVLFFRILNQTLVPTVSSMKVNEADVEVGSKKVHLVDIPGHARSRNQLWRDFLPIASGIIFVIDSVELKKTLPSFAEYLFDILSNKKFTSKKIPLLIVCNKTDILSTNSKKVIQIELEKELERIRKSKGTVLQLDQTEREEINFGIDGEDFRMEHLENNQVTFVEASAKSGDVQEVLDFIEANS